VFIKSYVANCTVHRGAGFRPVWPISILYAGKKGRDVSEVTNHLTKVRENQS
jgi:hypothetical protein